MKKYYGLHEKKLFIIDCIKGENYFDNKFTSEHFYTEHDILYVL